MWKSLSGKSSESSASSSSARRKASEPSSPSTRRRSESLVSSNSGRKPERKQNERDRDRITSKKHPSSSRDQDSHDYLERSTSGSFVTAMDTRRDERNPKQEITRYNTFPMASTNPRKAEEDGWVDEDDVASDTTRRSKHRKRSSSRERKQERRARSSSREKSEKKKSKKSSSSSIPDPRLDGKRSERTWSENTPKRDDDGKTTARSNRSSQEQYTRHVDMGDGSTKSISRDPAAQSSRMDAHVSSQFPGQDPAQFSAPYRPALNPTGGFGLAADYYGDQGESVTHQPGVRTSTPVIAGTQPHLQSASSVPAPPQETGHGLADDYYMSGALGEPQSQSTNNVSSPNPTEPRPSIKPSKTDFSPGTPGKFGGTSSSAQTAGAAYTMSNGTTHSNIQANGVYSNGTQYGVGAQMPYQNSATFAAGGQHSQFDHSTSAPALPTLGSTYAASVSAKPSTKPGKSSTQHSNAPLYAAAAGLAGVAAYQHQHHHSEAHQEQLNSTSYGGPTHGPSPEPYRPSPSPYAQGNGLRMKHRHEDPMGRLVDWWKDYEDVQKMEEYTEYIGVCRYCFDPRSNPMDAPRKHHYKRRRSSESLRGSRESLVRRSTENLSRPGRINKSSRYDRYDYSSDEERRRRSKSGNWAAAGLGAYGLGKLGKNLFGSGRDFDDTYSIRSGRFNESSTSLHRGHDYIHGRGTSTSHGSGPGRSEYGVIDSGHPHYRKEYVAHRPGHAHHEKQFVRHHSRSRSRSRSRDRRTSLLGAGLGVAAGASVIASSHRDRSKSPRKEIRAEKRRSRDPSPRPSVFGVSSRRTSSPQNQYIRHHEREKSPSMFSSFFGRSSPSPKRRSSRRHHERKEKKGFFNFSNSSSSSAGSDLVYGSKLDLSLGPHSHRRRSSPRRKASTRDMRKGEREDINKTLLGIGATAAAIGALNARESKKGKMHDIYTRPAGRTKVGKPASHRKASAGHADYSDSVDSDAAWESASEDEDSHSGASLAFGGSDIESRIVKSRKSTDSLVSNDSGLNILGWRFGGSGKKRRRSNSDLQRRHASEPFPAASLVNTTTSAAYFPPQTEIGSVVSSHSNLPTMQHIPPVPIQSFDPPSLGVPDYGSPVHHRHSSAPLSPRHQPEDPMIVTRPDPMPLQQPQPIKPVSPPKYTAPTGTPVFASDVGSDTGRKSSRRRASRTASADQAPAGGDNSFVRDAALVGVAGLGLASAMSKKDGKRKERDGTRTGYDSPSASQVRFDESREHPERGDKQSRNDRERRQQEGHERSEEVRLIEEERRERERARAAATKKRDEELERKARERREADLARSAEIRDRERKEKDEAERASAFRREAERQADANRLRDVEREKARKEADRRERELELDRERERERERQQREREHERESRKWKEAAAAGAAGATIGAVVAGMAHSASKDENREGSRDRKSKKERHPEERYDSENIVTQEITPTEEVFPTSDHKSPVLDDELMDRDYFNKGRVGTSIDAAVVANHERYDPTKEFDEFKQDFQNKYPQERQQHTSMAEFFSPPELHQPATGKTAVAPPHFPEDEAFDPPGSGRVPPYEQPYAFTSTHGAHGPISGAAAWAHHQIPSLRIISATPPPNIKGNSSPADSPVVETKDTTKSEVSSKSGSRSVSWGEDQTHVYHAVTPQASYESLVSGGKDQSTGPPPSESSSNTQPESTYPVPENLKQYMVDEDSGVKGDDEEGVEEITTPGVVVDDEGNFPNVFQYRTPWAESNSDVPGQVFVDPSPESFRRQDGGFVEEEFFGETLREGRMPGGFDDFEELSTPSERHETESRVEELPDTPKEKRDTEDDPDYFVSKKDKKKKSKSRKKEEIEEAAKIAATAAAVPLAAKVAWDVVQEHKAEPEENFERPLSKKEKKRETQRKRMSLDDGPPTPEGDTVEESAKGPATAAAVSEAENTASRTVKEALAEEEFETLSNKKERKKKDREKKRASLVDGPTTPMEESSSQFAKGVMAEPEQYEEAQSRSGAQIRQEPVVSIPGNAFNDLDELVSAKIPKSKVKRRSGRYSSPSAGSPLRSEVSYEGELDPYERKLEETRRDADLTVKSAAQVPLPEEGDDLTSSREPTKTTSRSSPEDREAGGVRESTKDKSSNDVEYADDDTRSRNSDPLDDRAERRKQRRRSIRNDSPDEDARSPAASEVASEPAYFYESSSKKTKHRSKRDDDDDDTRSVVSTPAKWDDKGSKSSSKEKKGGLFGFFKTKSDEKVETKRSSNDSPTRSKFDDDELEEGEKKKKKKKKHRSSDGNDFESVGRSEGTASRRSSKYDDDFDDTRSATSSSSRKQHKRRSTGDSYDDKGKHIQFLGPYAETVLRSPRRGAGYTKSCCYCSYQPK